MNKHQVYLHPDGKLEAVKFGICWPAFFLGPFWLLYRKIYSLAVLVFILTALVYLCVPLRVLGGLGFPNALITINLYDVIFLLVSLALAFTGNEFLRNSLRARGFAPIAQLRALSPDDARARYLRSQSGT